MKIARTHNKSRTLFFGEKNHARTEGQQSNTLRTSPDGDGQQSAQILRQQRMEDRYKMREFIR